MWTVIGCLVCLVAGAAGGWYAGKKKYLNLVADTYNEHVSEVKAKINNYKAKATAVKAALKG